MNELVLFSHSNSRGNWDQDQVQWMTHHHHGSMINLLTKQKTRHQFFRPHTSIGWDSFYITQSNRLKFFSAPAPAIVIPKMILFCFDWLHAPYEHLRETVALLSHTELQGTAAGLYAYPHIEVIQAIIIWSCPLPLLLAYAHTMQVNYLGLRTYWSELSRYSSSNRMTKEL